MKFKTTLLLSGNNTGIKVPPEVIEKLGAGKKPPVALTLNGSYSYRSTVAVMGGDFMIPFSSDHRAKSGLKGGDKLDVELTLDAAPREVEVPPALAAALAKDKTAKAAFEALSNSKKKVHTLSVEGAKTDETRDRRVAKAIAELKAGR
jgi:hypothetical protein